MMKDDLEEVFAQAMARHPRSLQEALGPSEIGDPCERKLAFKIGGRGPTNGGALPAWIGTQAHAGAAAAFEADNQRIKARRWITEQAVHIGMIMDGVSIDGTLDLFDTWTGTVIDFKFVGPSTLKNVRANGLSPVYRTQIHCYGLGMSQAQEVVKQVGVYYLPRDGHLKAAKLILEPYDPGIPQQALARLSRIAAGMRQHGDPMRFKTEESYCHNCPFFSGGSNDPRAICPGHGSANSEAMTLSFTQ